MVRYNSNILILIAIIGLVVLFSGCTGGQDVTPIVKALPEVQQFLKEHPNATIIVTYWSKEEVANSSQQISQQCDKSITPAAMYKATVGEGNLKIVSWIDAENRIVICSATEGKQNAIPTPTATVTQTTVESTPTPTPVETGYIVIVPDNNSATKPTSTATFTPTWSAIKFIAVVGTRTDAQFATPVSSLNVSVVLSAGGSQIDFGKVIVKYISETTTSTLSYGVTADAAHFTYTKVRDASGTGASILAADDLGIITINLDTSTGTNQGLEVRKKGTIQIIPETSTMVVKDIVAPATYGTYTQTQLFP